MVEELRDSVDVRMVFGGLFSAIVTTFVVQTSQSLQVNYAAMSAFLLYESLLVQRAIGNGSSVDSIAPSPIAFLPAATDVWVNGLWFTSLFLSLTTALVAVLVKQWVHHYVALPSGTPRDQSLTRQIRFAGLTSAPVSSLSPCQMCPRRQHGSSTSQHSLALAARCKQRGWKRHSSVPSKAAQETFWIQAGSQNEASWSCIVISLKFSGG
ncbi:hypothetical protein IW261DRAFT_524862 [Armillaria novae-zelandiae]|uniref:DUF6535 domain-containing protein n=1 Tax=Armillaria novae-zelandiae TaxID=153914 RepID=A0AA39UDK7_9AGAR|nr:hypothetical protein IW261DRAFT_524862 [Armillaria novae-zelandiae]